MGETQDKDWKPKLDSRINAKKEAVSEATKQGRDALLQHKSDIMIDWRDANFDFLKHKIPEMEAALIGNKDAQDALKLYVDTRNPTSDAYGKGEEKGKNSYVIALFQALLYAKADSNTRNTLSNNKQYGQCKCGVDGYYGVQTLLASANVVNVPDFHGVMDETFFAKLIGTPNIPVNNGTTDQVDKNQTTVSVDSQTVVKNPVSVDDSTTVAVDSNKVNNPVNDQKLSTDNQKDTNPSVVESQSSVFDKYGLTPYTLGKIKDINIDVTYGSDALVIDSSKSFGAQYDASGKVDFSPLSNITLKNDSGIIITDVAFANKAFGEFLYFNLKDTKNNKIINNYVFSKKGRNEYSQQQKIYALSTGSGNKKLIIPELNAAVNLDSKAKQQEEKVIPEKLSPITNPEAVNTSTDVVKETPQSNDPTVFLEQGKTNYMMKLKKDALKGSVDSYQFTDEQTKKLKKVMQINDDGDVKSTWNKAIESATDDAALLKVTTRINQQMNQVNKDLSKNFWRKLGLKKESTVEDVVSKKAKTFENKQDVKDLLVATNTVNLNETKVDTETAKNNADAAMDGYLSLFTQLKDASAQTQKADAENINATGNANTELEKTKLETGSILAKDKEIDSQANITKEAGAIQSDKILTLEEAKNKEIQLSNDIMPKATQFTNSVTAYIAKIQESKDADKGNISALTRALNDRVGKDKGVFTSGFGDTSTAWGKLLGDIKTFDGEYKNAKSAVVTEQTDDAGNTIPIIQEDQIALMYTKSEAITQTRSELEQKTNLGLQQYADLSITIQSLYEMIQDDASKKVNVLVSHIASLTNWKDKVTTQINDVDSQLIQLRGSRKLDEDNSPIDASIIVMEKLRGSLESTKKTIVEPEIKKLEDEKVQFDNKVTAAKNANLYTQGVTKQRMIDFWRSQKKSEVAFEENLVGLLSSEKSSNEKKKKTITETQIPIIDQKIALSLRERQKIYDAKTELAQEDELHKLTDEIQKQDTEKKGLEAVTKLLDSKNLEIDSKVIESNKSITEGKLQIAGYEKQSTDLGAQLQKLVNETPNADLNDYQEFFPVKTYTENNLQLESPFEQK